MSTIQNLFEQAQLAEAAYADLTSAIGNQNILKDALNVANKDAFGGSFSTAQATAFTNEWSVVDQYDNSALFGLRGTGFSATVFKNKTTNQYSFAIRGSSDFADFSADKSLITTDGVAVSQLVDMYNYWQRLTHLGVYQAATLTTQYVASAFLTILHAGAAANIPDGLATLFGGATSISSYDVARAVLLNNGYIVEGGSNYLDGGDGTDTLNSGGPGSTLLGGAGDDNLSALGGSNYLDGGDGSNTLIAEGGNNIARFIIWFNLYCRQHNTSMAWHGRMAVFNKQKMTRNTTFNYRGSHETNCGDCFGFSWASVEPHCSGGEF